MISYQTLRLPFDFALPHLQSKQMTTFPNLNSISGSDKTYLGIGLALYLVVKLYGKSMVGYVC